MLVYSLAAFALLAFWLFADKRRFAELFPSMLAGALLRMKEEYLLIHIFPLWEYKQLEPIFRPLKLPVLLDLTFFPVVSYLFVQFLPAGRLVKFGYVLLVSALLTGYEQIMLSFGHLEQHPKWNLLLTYLLFLAFFALVSLQYSFYRRTT